MSPSTVYEIGSPCFCPLMVGRRHHQIADKAFEPMIGYLSDQKMSFNELERVIQVDGKVVAEWEGFSN